jgi:UDP-N-acetylglucosamine enolpyruvyl transferase
MQTFVVTGTRTYEATVVFHVVAETEEAAIKLADEGDSAEILNGSEQVTEVSLSTIRWVGYDTDLTASVLTD